MLDEHDRITARTALGMKEVPGEITQVDLSPLKRTSTQKKLKKARSKMEHADIADKTVGGQKKWMDCKIKRDIEERKREPYDENK